MTGSVEAVPPVRMRTVQPKGESIRQVVSTDNSPLFSKPLNTGKKLRGFVDMHTHPMSHLGFGGKVVHGAPGVDVLMPAGAIYDMRGIGLEGLRAMRSPGELAQSPKRSVVATARTQGMTTSTTSAVTTRGGSYSTVLRTERRRTSRTTNLTRPGIRRLLAGRGTTTSCTNRCGSTGSEGRMREGCV